MNELERVTHRSNLVTLICGLIGLISSVSAAVGIWIYPYSGPDVRSEFCLLLIPGFALGVVCTVWGAWDLRASKKKARALANS